jgi:hypothetical protein
MLGILDAKDGSAALIVEPTPAESELDEPADTFVSPSEPLPDDAHPRWRVARTALEAELAKVDDPRAERYQCWLATLQMGGDDRVIEWQAICPSTSGAIGAAAIVGPCELTGRNVDQTELEAAISSVEDVVPANERLSFITHLRPQIVRSHELTDFPVENFRQVHDQVQDAIRKLDVWANSPIPIDGADRAMPPAYIAIKDWIGRQQKNTDSVYSCF